MFGELEYRLHVERGGRLAPVSGWLSEIEACLAASVWEGITGQAVTRSIRRREPLTDLELAAAQNRDTLPPEALSERDTLIPTVESDYPYSEMQHD